MTEINSDNTYVSSFFKDFSVYTMKQFNQIETTVFFNTLNFCIIFIIFMVKYYTIIQY